MSTKDDSNNEGPERIYTFAVIGGGIAGVSCVEQILEFDPDAKILLISASPVVKEASQYNTDFVIVEKSLKSFKDVHQSVCVVQADVSQLLPDEHEIVTSTGQRFRYKKVCICTGASPRVLFPGSEHVIGIRDTESVAELAQKISKCRKVIVLGNGGIATEFVYEVQGVEVVWAIKDESISAHFIDPGAAEFFIQCKLGETKTSSVANNSFPPTLSPSTLTPAPAENERQSSPSKRRKYTITSIPPVAECTKVENSERSQMGSALGPDWHQNVALKGQTMKKNVEILYKTECCSIVKSEEKDDWPIYAELTNNQKVGCDLVISATGVLPNCGFLNCCNQDSEKGIFVDEGMRTSAKDVFAAGDVCFPNWEWSKHWFQMRLWTQARHMGLYAGKCMWLSVQNELCPEEAVEPDLDFCFETFSHVTRFFGFKVVFLGLYNGQGLDKSRQHLIVRCTKNLEYVKVVLEDWRMQGALIIGETGLEETFENLVLNQVDLSPYGEDLLNPDIDIEDYFD